MSKIDGFNQRIRKAEEAKKYKDTFWVTSSHGKLLVYPSGKIAQVIEDNIHDPENYLGLIEKFDVERYKNIHNLDKMPESIDILRLGSWGKDGTYDDAHPLYELHTEHL
jgi:hypothetical protein